MRDVIGTPPVHPALLVAGKIGFGIPWLVLGLRLAGTDPLGVTVRAARIPAAAAALVGAGLVVSSLVRLGSGARVGLPPDAAETILATGGPYRCSRNPVYAGAILGCIASCIYVPHPVNIVSTIAAALIHHRVVLAEERFLEERFGDEWRDYRLRVRRYL